MIRISLSYVYELAASLEPLTELESALAYKNAFLVMSKAIAALDGLLNGSVFSFDLRSSRQAGLKLLSDLRTADREMGVDWDKELGSHGWQIKYAYQAFRPVLLAELGVAPSYFVTRPEAYDTLSLLDDGALLFPAALRTKVPEAIFDAQQAGKALAFELGTACGFHVFRVTESVLRRYYEKVTGNAPKPKTRNLGVYLHVLNEQNLGNERVRAALKQLVDLHRNPLIHPEVALTTEDAITIVGMARSAVGMMLAEIPDAEATTSSALAAMFTEFGDKG